MYFVCSSKSLALKSYQLMVLICSLVFVISSSVQAQEEGEGVNRDNISLHRLLQRPLASQNRDVEVPTLLAQRELDVMLPLNSLEKGVLTCNFDYSVLSALDYDGIKAYQALNGEDWDTKTETEQQLFLNTLYKDMVMWLGYGSQQGAYVNINREEQTINGRLVTVEDTLDASDLGFMDSNFTLALKTKIDNLARKRFSIDEQVQEYWSSMNGDAKVYVTKYDYSENSEAYILELRVFENWDSQVSVRRLGENFFGGYAQLLIYTLEGYLIAFNVGSCIPAIF